VRNSAGPAADELPKNLVGWVARTMGPGSRIQVVRRLPMGSWHLNHALTVVDGDGRVHRLVLRRWARLGWDRDDPDYTAAREMTILELLRPTPVPAPVLVGADIEGDECEVPTLLLTRLPGHPPTAADMAANRFCPDLAQTLAVVHDAGRALSGQLAPYRLYYDRAEATPPRWLTNTPVWQQAAAAVRAVPPAASQTMIHRDFHPENTLWSRGRLTGTEFGTRLLSDQLSDYRVDDPYIHAHLHGLSSRLVLALDDSPTLLWDEEVTAAVAAIVTSCLTIWPGSTCRVSTLSIRRGQHQPQPVFSDLCDPEIESYLVALAAFDASTLSSHLFVPRDIRSSASRFFRSAPHLPLSSSPGR
jgi:hypothetical protein